MLFGLPFTKLYRLTDGTRTYAIHFMAILALICPFASVEMTGIIKLNIILEALVGVWRIPSIKWVRNLTSG